MRVWELAVLFATACSASSPPCTFVDKFTEPTLDPRWNYIDPTNATAAASVSDGALQIAFQPGIAGQNGIATSAGYSFWWGMALSATVTLGGDSGNVDASLSGRLAPPNGSSFFQLTVGTQVAGCGAAIGGHPTDFGSLLGDFAQARVRIRFDHATGKLVCEAATPGGDWQLVGSGYPPVDPQSDWILYVDSSAASDPAPGTTRITDVEFCST